MTKTVKIYLICKGIDKKGNIIEADDDYYKKVNSILWELQKQTRMLKNKTIQLCWEWRGFASDYKEKNGSSPKESDILGLTLRGFVNKSLRVNSDLYSSNCSTTTSEAIKQFKNAEKDVLKGTKSIINYKSDQPLELHNEAIHLLYNNDHKEYQFKLAVLKKDAVKKYNTTGTMFAFKGNIKDKSTETILQRCIDGIYKVSASKLMYDRKKKM